MALHAMPKRVRPMLARVGPLPSVEQDWAFEVKWDGVRALAYWNGNELRLESRSLNDVSARYPELRALGDQLGGHTALLDGEIVSFDEHSTPSFERLQRRMHVTSTPTVARLAREQPVTYVIFDLLELDGRDTTKLPYEQRRELLEQLGLQGAAWQTPPYYRGEGHALQAATAQLGLEGMLAKRLDSPYRPGLRTGDWLKIKNVNRQELVIGGWLPGKGRRAGTLGALLLGYYEPTTHGPSELRFAGRAGTGFDEPELRRLSEELAARARKRSPFSRSGEQPPRDSHFVAPELIVEVQFSSWTQQGVLRHPIYKGLRADKPARQVRRESAQGTTPYRVLEETRTHADIEAQGRTLRLSNRTKVLYPRTGFTKGDLIDYYAAVSPVMLAHLRDRAITLKRYPDGVDRDYFYEKHCPSHRPEWVHTAPIWSESVKRTVRYCVVDDLPTLLWTANLAGIELHSSLALARWVERPTALVFDLDPGPPAALKECCQVALRIKDLLDAFDLRTVVKTSGSAGLQVYLPLNSQLTYEHTKPFARAVAELLEKQHPREVVSRMARRLRRGRVFIDWSQNDEHKTTVCAYSLRAAESPLASTPLQWEEVQRGARKRSAFQLSAAPQELLERVERYGDPFAPLLSLEQSLPVLS